MDAFWWALIPISMFIAMGMGHALRGPLGKAIADRIAGRAGSARDRELADRVTGELDELRHRVAELEERQDFTERVIARERTQDRLAGGP